MIPMVTERLILRTWREEDRAPFAAMNADPEVMQHFPEPLTEEESKGLVDRFERIYADTGMTFFAAEEQASGRFIGTIGLKPVSGHLPIAPAVEIGWRLVADVWGQGYATEGARAMLRAGFEDYELDRLLAYTTPPNKASWRVMEKIGLLRDADADFDHPDLAPDHPLLRHIVYSVDRETWMSSPNAPVTL